MAGGPGFAVRDRRGKRGAEVVKCTVALWYARLPFRSRRIIFRPVSEMPNCRPWMD